MYLWTPHKTSLSKSVKYKGATVVYSQTGGGQPMVLLHGFLEERGMWDAYVEVLSKDFNVICVDLLGQGETDSIGYVHSMEEHAKAVKAVLDAEGIENYMVIGHSMGGYVALALAELYPETIDRLVLFHSTSYPDSDERKLDRERVINLVQRNKSIYVKTVIPSLFADETREGLTKEIQQTIDVATGFSEQGIIANIRGMMERPSRESVLRDGDFPKLIVHGNLDPVISTEDMQKQAALNDNISLKVVDGIGHMGHLEASDVCLQLITDFCNN